MKITRPWLAPLWAALLCSSIASADDATEARDILTRFLSGTETYQARFTQEVTDERGDLIEESSGGFSLARPGRFRWHYEEPLEQLLISDGELIWLYDVDLEQATVRSAAGALEQTPAGILVGEPGALEGYELGMAEKSAASSTIVLRPLVPGQSDFRRIALGFAAGELVTLELADSFGQNTLVQFTDARVNSALDPQLFEFEVPEGTDVIDQTTDEP